MTQILSAQDVKDSQGRPGRAEDRLNPRKGTESEWGVTQQRLPREGEGEYSPLAENFRSFRVGLGTIYADTVSQVGEWCRHDCGEKVHPWLWEDSVFKHCQVLRSLWMGPAGQQPGVLGSSVETLTAQGSDLDFDQIPSHPAETHPFHWPGGGLGHWDFQGLPGQCHWHSTKSLVWTSEQLGSATSSARLAG